MSHYTKTSAKSNSNFTSKMSCRLLNNATSQPTLLSNYAVYVSLVLAVLPNILQRLPHVQEPVAELIRNSIP